MKVKTQKETKTYEPFNLIITIEWPDEAADLYALFNHTQIVQTCRNIDSDKIRDAIRSGHGQKPAYEATHEALTELL